MQTNVTPLIKQVTTLEVPYGQLALWSLGQAGFVIKGGNTLACIDPYLSGGNERRVPIVFPPDALTTLNAVFATHEHLDHADAQTLGPMLAASRAATLVTSPQGREIALAADVDDERIIVPRLGESSSLGQLTYTAIPAAHYSYEVDAAGRSRWMGFVIECNGVSLYHSGDTIMFPELRTALEQVRVDIALLPINGRDFMRDARDIIGNLWPHEAVQVAQMVEATVLIGMHNDLFAGNRVSSGMLFDAVDRLAPAQRCHLLQAGEPYLFVK
jgi:L-ascorbate metabolism protein UlaG (beta-lactamase superfamily)